MRNDSGPRRPVINERGWAMGWAWTPTQSKAGPKLPSWLAVRRKVAISSLCSVVCVPRLYNVPYDTHLVEFFKLSSWLSSLWAWRHKTGFQAAPASRAWVWTLPRASDRSATTSTSARTKMAAASRILCVSTPMDPSTVVPALLVSFRIFYAIQRGANACVQDSFTCEDLRNFANFFCTKKMGK